MRIFWEIAIFSCISYLSMADPVITIAFPRNGGIFPGGTGKSYVIGRVSPADTPLTCNGRRVSVFRMSGAFLLMESLSPGKNLWEFKAGKTTLRWGVRVREAAKGPSAVRLPQNGIKPLTLLKPLGVMPGSEVTFACRAPAGRAVNVMVGERNIALQPQTGDPESYRATRRFEASAIEMPVLYWSEGLEDAPAASLTVGEKWPVYRITGPLFKTRAYDAPNGNTCEVPPRGACFRGAGFRDGFVRLLSGGRELWIAESALEIQPEGENPPDLLPSLGDLYPARPAAGKQPEDLLIVVDPGHGGSDSGALGPSGTTEKEANLKQAILIAGALKRAGFRVKMTRTEDRTVPIYDRPAFAYGQGADAFISIHHNSTAPSVDPRPVRHFVTFGWNERGLALARALHGELAKVSGLRDSGVQTRSLAVCRNPAVPSCLVEFDFINCPEGEYEIFEGDRMKRYAEALVKGLKQWMNPGSRMKGEKE